ncbi:MAG: diacylglycerol kinase family lipid kinase [Clostridiales bacterium]|nr:diacylglycerol kinase family lipid kinase [Clostridiales bacterium]
MNKKLLLILNPCSGQKKANRYIINIVSLFTSAGYDCTFHVTQKSGDATEFVENNAKNYDLIVCIGGDGTLNEVITGLINGECDVPIGYIPSGSTNDFANSLELSKNPVQAARNIIKGTQKAYDVGSFNGRCFCYIASFGAFTRVSYDTPQTLKNSLGHAAYVLESIKELTELKPIHAKITANGEIYEDDYLFGAISNSTSIAGLLTLSPEQVDLSDGLLEVLLIKNPTNPVEINNIIMALTLRQYNNDTVKFFSARKIEVEISPTVNWTLDGEFAESTEKIVIENLNQAVEIIK